MFTVKELAVYLKISTATIYRLTESKKLSYRKIGGQLRFTKKDIAEYLKCEVADISL